MPTPSPNVPPERPPHGSYPSSCPDPDTMESSTTGVHPGTLRDESQSPSASDFESQQQRQSYAREALAAWHESQPSPDGSEDSMYVETPTTTGLSHTTATSARRRSGREMDGLEHNQLDGMVLDGDEAQKQADAEMDDATRPMRSEMGSPMSESRMTPESTSLMVMTGLGEGEGASGSNVASRMARRPEKGRESAERSRRFPAPVLGNVQESDGWGVVTGGQHRPVEDSGLSGMGTEFSRTRAVPITPCWYLRPGSKFKGTQQSERQQYDVQVEIKHVDLRESFLCGYLRIQGLTDDHPTLTTYFEGEIIGAKYGFITQHPSWGANEKIDLQHWGKFAAFRPFQRPAKKGQVVHMDYSDQECIFMRWKEHFLVPDHRVRTISGASFEGFYYICFNQRRGEVSGIYFHSRSERFQQLELKHVEDKGCFGALEFR